MHFKKLLFINFILLGLNFGLDVLFAQNNTQFFSVTSDGNIIDFQKEVTLHPEVYGQIDDVSRYSPAFNPTYGFDRRVIGTMVSLSQ